MPAWRKQSREWVPHRRQPGCGLPWDWWESSPILSHFRGSESNQNTAENPLVTAASVIFKNHRTIRLNPMTIPYWCAWYAGGNLAIPKLTGQESAALLMLAAGMLVYRTFKERY